MPSWSEIFNNFNRTKESDRISYLVKEKSNILMKYQDAQVVMLSPTIPVGCRNLQLPMCLSTTKT